MMIDQAIYKVLCRAFLSPAVLNIVQNQYRNYDALFRALEENFSQLEKTSLSKNELAELYAFSDYLKDYQPPEDAEVWVTGDDDLSEKDKYNEEECTEETQLSWIEERREMIKKWKEQNEERKRIQQELIDKIKKDVKTILLKAGKPLTFDEIVSQYRNLHPDASIKDFIFRKCLKSKTFTNFGKKSLYVVKGKSKNIFVGSLYEAVSKVLHSKSKPFLMEELVNGVLELRPDSNPRSVQSVVTSMLKSNKIFLFNENYIGLNTIRYHKSFKHTKYQARQTFEDKLKEVKEFVALNHRLPFTNGPQSETSLAVWFNRTIQNTNLTTQQMVAFYNFRQEIDAFGIPQNVEQFEFRQKCKEYKSRVMRTGKLISYHEDRMLYTWFKKSCERYSTFNDARKIYFDELIQFLLAFGYELNLG